MSIPVIDLSPTSTEFEIPVRKGKEQEKIFCRTWGHSDAAYVTVLCHGLGAHSGWFEPLASRLASCKHRVYSCDLSGFGHGDRRSFDSYRQWQDDLIALTNHAKEENPGKPLVLAGNSMGALVALSSLDRLEQPPSAMLLMSPGFEGFAGTFTLPYKLKAILTALVAPGKIIALPYSVDDITVNEKIREQVNADKLGKFAIPAGLGLELLKLTKEAVRKSKSLPCPVYLATAGQERIVDNRMNDRFFEGLDCPAKERVHFNECRHDLVFEDSVSSLADGFSAWLTPFVSA